jgi:hypothetical protein
MKRVSLPFDAGLGIYFWPLPQGGANAAVKSKQDKDL